MKNTFLCLVFFAILAKACGNGVTGIHPKTSGALKDDCGSDGSNSRSETCENMYGKYRLDVFLGTQRKEKAAANDNRNYDMRKIIHSIRENTKTTREEVHNTKLCVKRLVYIYLPKIQQFERSIRNHVVALKRIAVELEVMKSTTKNKFIIENIEIAEKLFQRFEHRKAITKQELEQIESMRRATKKKIKTCMKKNENIIQKVGHGKALLNTLRSLAFHDLHDIAYASDIEEELLRLQREGALLNEELMETVDIFKN